MKKSIMNGKTKSLRHFVPRHKKRRRLHPEHARNMEKSDDNTLKPVRPKNSYYIPTILQREKDSKNICEQQKPGRRVGKCSFNNLCIKSHSILIRESPYIP